MKHKRGVYDVFLQACTKYPSKVAIRVYDNESYLKYTYSELYGVCEYIAQNLQMLVSSGDEAKGVIGILTSAANVIVPCAVAAIQKCCLTFMFLNKEPNLHTLSEKIKFTLIMTIENDASLLLGKSPDKVIKVFDKIIEFFSFQSLMCIGFEGYDSAYIATTSGSTGEPKHIHVPFHCIMPNIDDLSTTFLITDSDVINFSTPLTFDPSMVELLLALKNGASLLIAPDTASVLFPDDPENSVTFWQTTPSKFFLYSDEDISNHILSPKSTLKVLALGGEPMNGIARLKTLKSSENKTKVFTLYGVTEMSCWACVAELDLDKIENDSDVPLGQCLSETQLALECKSNETVGKIVLLSNSRKCFYASNCKDLTELSRVDTGDLAAVRNGTVYYRGRRDDVIKRFGSKIHLRIIENTVMQIAPVNACCCIWLDKPMLLVLYFSSNICSSSEVSEYIKRNLHTSYWPDHVIKVDSLPITEHGKINKKTLSKQIRFNDFIDWIEKSTTCLKSVLLSELQETFSKKYTYEDLRHKDFFSIGGTSILAVTMCNKLSNKYPNLGKVVLPYLLHQKNTIEDVIRLVEGKIMPSYHPNSKADLSKTDLKRKQDPKPSLVDLPVKKSVTLNSNNEFSILWQHGMEKCVDASPMLILSEFNQVVAVGSHSGLILVADAATGAIHGTLSLNSRIEAAILCCSDKRNVSAPRGFIGTYDGTILCFLLNECTEVWKTYIDAMIKSKAACYKHSVYVASYDGMVRCLNYHNGEIKYSIKVSDQAISADLVASRSGHILVGTLSGTCACIDARKNKLVWNQSLESPVFAAPALYNDDKKAVILEVNGSVHGINVCNGVRLWKFDSTGGNIFSSIHIIEENLTNWQMVFGCHDGFLYCLTVVNNNVNLHWKTTLSSEIYATATSINASCFLAATTNGQLCVVDRNDGKLVSQFTLPGEVFSSPAVWGDNIYVGCRDDNLYAIKYTGCGSDSSSVFSKSSTNMLLDRTLKTVYAPQQIIPSKC